MHQPAALRMSPLSRATRSKWFARPLLLVLLVLGTACEPLKDMMDEGEESSPPPAPAAGVECWQSFGEFKDTMEARGKKPPDGQQWHHIVEQTLNQKRFANRLHCTDNVIAIPTQIHHKISGHYSSKPDWAHGERVRDLVSTWTWDKQYEYGLERLRLEGITP